MKKYMALISAAVIILTSFSGCSSTYEKGMSPGHVANALGPKVIDYINNKDAESLKELYSEEVYNSYNLDDELQLVFDFVGGNITSYSRIKLGSESESITEGKAVKNNFDVCIEDAKTDTGNIYLIVFSYISVNNEQPNSVGMYRLSVYDNDDYNISASAGRVYKR